MSDCFSASKAIDTAHDDDGATGNDSDADTDKKNNDHDNDHGMRTHNHTLYVC